MHSFSLCLNMKDLSNFPVCCYYYSIFYYYKFLPSLLYILFASIYIIILILFSNYILCLQTYYYQYLYPLMIYVHLSSSYFNITRSTVIFLHILLLLYSVLYQTKFHYLLIWLPYYLSMAKVVLVLLPTLIIKPSRMSWKTSRFNVSQISSFWHIYVYINPFKNNQYLSQPKCLF